MIGRAECAENAAARSAAPLEFPGGAGSISVFPVSAVVTVLAPERPVAGGGRLVDGRDEDQPAGCGDGGAVLADGVYVG